MSCLSNTPSFTYVSVQNMIIFSNNIYYSINDMYSNDKYFYWDKNESPNDLITSNKLLDDKNGLYLVVVNNKGTFILPNQTEIVINFDDRGTNANGSISNLIGKVDDLEKKYVNINQTIDGITSSIGTLRESIKGSKTMYTELKQTAEGIKLLAENMDKQYSEDNTENYIRQEIVGATISLNTNLSELLKKIRDVSSDGIVSDSENLELIQVANKLDESKFIFDNCTKELLDIMEKQNRKNDYEALKSQKESFNVSYDNLKTILYSTIDDKMLTHTEIATLIGAVTNCTTKLNELKEVCNDFLFLGIGGTLYEEIAKFNVEKDKIDLNLKSVTTTMKNAFSLEKSLVQTQYEDVLSTIAELQNWIMDSSKDGTITQLENSILEERINAFNSQNNDLLDKYAELYDIFTLNPEQLTKLEDSYKDYYISTRTAFNYLYVINEDKYFNSVERDKINSYIESLRINLQRFYSVLMNSISVSEENKRQSEIEDTKAEYREQLDDVNTELSNVIDITHNTFADNVIDKIERASIIESLDAITLQKNNIESQYQEIKNRECFTTPNDVSNMLDSKYTSFVNSYNALNEKVTQILEKTTLVTNEDKADMEILKDNILFAMNEYVSASNNALMYVSENEAQTIVNTFEQRVSEVEDLANGLTGDFNETFNNNIIDSTERGMAKLRKDNLEKEHSELLDLYYEYRDSLLLPNEDKTTLTNTYVSYSNAYQDLITTINGIIDKNELVDDIDKENLDAKLNSFKTELDSFSAILKTCSDKIISKRISDGTVDFNARLNSIESALENSGSAVEAAISDNILDKVERDRLSRLSQTIENERRILTMEFERIRALLPNSLVFEKTQERYTILEANIVDLILTIDEILEIPEEENIPQTNKDTYNIIFEGYETSLANFKIEYEKALKEYSNKEKDTARLILTKETKDILEMSEDLEGAMLGIFQDHYLTDQEKNTLTQRVNNLISKKEALLERINVISPYLSEDKRMILDNYFTDYSVSIEVLQNKINTLIARTDMLTESDRDYMIQELERVRYHLGKFSEVFNIYTQDSVVGFIDTAKTDLNNSIREVDTKVNELDEEMNGVFKDGILTQVEKESIKESVRQLEIEKTDIDADYESIYNNVDLLDEINISNLQADNSITIEQNIVNAKTGLANKYTEYCTAHTNLITYLNNFVNLGETIMGTEELIELNTLFDTYKSALSEYRTALNTAIDAIALKKVCDERALRITREQGINTRIGLVEVYARETKENLDALTESTSESFSQLTPTGIINTVLNTTNEAGEKVFFEHSEFKQEVDKITASFVSTDLLNEKLNNNITEFSSKGIEIKMYDDESFDEEGELIASSSAIARTNLNGQGLSIYREEGTPIAYFNENQCYIEKVKTKEIECSRIVKTSKNLDIPLHWYIAQTSTGDGSGKDSDNKSNTINGALNYIKDTYGEYLGNKDIVINIESGEYYEVVNINGFIGTGSLTLRFSTESVLFGCINVFDNIIPIELDGQKTKTSNAGAVIYSSQTQNQDAIFVRNSNCNITGFKAKNLSASGTEYSCSFARFKGSATGIVKNCDMIFYQNAFLSEYSAHLTIWDNMGKVANRRNVLNGGIMISGGEVPLSDNGDSSTRGFIHSTGTLTEKPSLGWYDGFTGVSTGGGTTPPTPGGNTGGQDGVQEKTITQTFTLIDLKSTMEAGTGSGGAARSGYVVQGKYETFRAHRGHAYAPPELLAFVSDVKTIEEVTISLHRLNTAHGISSAVPYPIMRMYNTKTGGASQEFSNPSIKFARGETHSFAITNADFIEKIKNGYNDLQFYAGTSTTQYSMYDQIKLTLKVTKDVG